MPDDLIVHEPEILVAPFNWHQFIRTVLEAMLAALAQIKSTSPRYPEGEYCTAMIADVEYILVLLKEKKYADIVTTFTTISGRHAQLRMLRVKSTLQFAQFYASVSGQCVVLWHLFREMADIHSSPELKVKILTSVPGAPF